MTNMMNPTTLSVNDLEAFSVAQVTLTNNVLSVTAGRTYQVSGRHVRLNIVQAAADQSKLMAAIQFNGQNILLGLSESLVNSLLADEDVSIEDLNLDILTLLFRVKFAPKMPQGVQFKDLVFSNQNGLEESFKALPKQLVLQAVDAQTHERMGWELCIHAMPQTSLAAFLKCFEFLVIDVAPSPLLKVRLPLPIIAAKTAIPAQQVQDIAVGDVILFG